MINQDGQIRKWQGPYMREIDAKCAEFRKAKDGQEHKSAPRERGTETPTREHMNGRFVAGGVAIIPVFILSVNTAECVKRKQTWKLA